MDDNNQPNQVPEPQSMPPSQQPVQQSPQPFPDTNPSQPQATGPVGGYQMPAKKGLSKGALWGIIGGVVGLVVLIVGVVLAVVFLGGPTRADYQAANAVSSDLISEYNKTERVYITSYTSDEDRQSQIDDYKKSYASVVEKYNRLKDMKAVKNDPEVAEKFKAISAKYDKYVEAHETKLEAYDKIYSLLSKINSSPSDADSAMKLLEDMQVELKNMDMKTKVNKDYVADLSPKVDKLVTLTKKMIEMQEDGSKYDSNVARDFRALQTELSDSDRTWQSNLNKLSDEGKISSELNSLRSVIRQKALK